MELTQNLIAKTAQICQNLNMNESNNLVLILERAYYTGNQIFIFGNGGSGATASHFCEDLGKGTLKSLHDETRFKVMSLTDNVPYILAWANDEGYDTVFEQQLRNFAEPHDVVIGISGSGNSPNVLKAIDYANAHNMITVGMTGFNGGELNKRVMHRVHVPVNDMGIAESVHLIIVHYVVQELVRRLHTNGKSAMKKEELVKSQSQPVTVVEL